MTIAVDLGRKATKQTHKQPKDKYMFGSHETFFMTARLYNKVIDIIKFVKHFLNSITDTQG